MAIRVVFRLVADHCQHRQKLPTRRQLFHPRHGMAIVIDASVGLKWLLAEDDSYIAQALAVSNEELLAPDSWLNEACNILWLQVRRNVFTASEAEEGLGLLRA